MRFCVGFVAFLAVVFGAGVAGEARVLRGFWGSARKPRVGFGLSLFQFASVFLGVVRRCVAHVGFGAPKVPEVGRMSRRL